ncbi:P type cation [Roseibium sp. TrichSKD4]|nr:P type cation [Roseibium sp. TrichSKD4]
MASIEKAIIALDTNASVACDLENRTVAIETKTPAENVEAALRKIGFEPEVVPSD